MEGESTAMNYVNRSDCKTDCEAPCTIKGHKNRLSTVEHHFDSDYKNIVVHELERDIQMAANATNDHTMQPDYMDYSSTWQTDHPMYLTPNKSYNDDQQSEMMTQNMAENEAYDHEDNLPEIRKKPTVLVLLVNPAVIYPNDNSPPPAPLNYSHQAEQCQQNRQNDAANDLANHQEHRPYCRQQPASGQMDYECQNSFQNQPMCLCQDNIDERYGGNSNPMCNCDYDSDICDSQVTTQMGCELLKLLAQHRTLGKGKANNRITKTNKKLASKTNQKALNKKGTNMKDIFYNRFSTPPFVIEPKPRCYCIRGPVCCNSCNSCQSCQGCNSCRCFYQY